MSRFIQRQILNVPAVPKDDWKKQKVILSVWIGGFNFIAMPALPKVSYQLMVQIQ